MNLHVSCFGGERGLDSSTWPRAEMAYLQRDSRSGVGMRERAQDLRSPLHFFITTARMAAEFVEEDGEGEQHFVMISLHGRKLDQPGSNLKKLERGVVVVTCMMRGTSLEVKRASEVNDVLGNASAQARLKKHGQYVPWWALIDCWTT